MAKRVGVVAGANIPLSRFGVLVAQLESIAASAKQQSPDALLCFDLLSELVFSLEEESKESITQWQRKCEDALYSLLTLGARRPVRRLASLAMGRIIAKGDSISIYSRASTLQGWLADGKRSDPLAVAGVVQCLGELYHFFGRRITSGLTETTSIAAKLMKFNEDFVRQDALQMLCNALIGCEGAGPAAAYTEAYRVIMRFGVIDKAFTVRLTAAKCLKAFANIGGPNLGSAELENATAYCVKALEDPAVSVRDAFVEALGTMLALGMNWENKTLQSGLNTIPAKKMESALQKHLILPFTKATGVNAKELRIGLTLSWVHFLQVMCFKYDLQNGELQNFALLALNMLGENLSVEAHPLACVLYILRVGITDQMAESAQRGFLVLLAKELELSDYSSSKGVAVLRTLSYILAVLGEVPSEFKDVIDNTVVAALSHSAVNVRVEAALMLRGLAEVDPTCVGGLISYGVTTLYALRESIYFEKGNRLNREVDSLHGQATVLAALVSVSPRLPLGYPARLPGTVFEVSKKMLTGSSRNSSVASIEKEAGWLLLASLIASMPKEELEDMIFDVLMLWVDPLGRHPEEKVLKIEDLVSEIRVLSSAMEALTAFIGSFLSPSLTTSANSKVINEAVLLQPILIYLSGALSCVLALATKQVETLRPLLDLFTIRTLSAYQSISDPMIYRNDHPRIIRLCTSPFRDPFVWEESSCLWLLLDKKDSSLGPWIPGRDWFEDELRAFQGGKDGLMPCVWDKDIPTFPQPDTLSKLLVNQLLLSFGCMFAAQDNNGKSMLLNLIDQCLKNGKRQSWHPSSVTNACVALLSGLKALIGSRPQSIDFDILCSMQSIFQGILSEGEISAAQRRASAEGLGFLARLGSDSFTARMTRTLLSELSAASDPFHIGSLALALGCIHRSVGGMALSTLVPLTVTTIASLARSSNAVLQQWSLHALLLTIEAAGLSYVPHVQSTLSLATEILLSEEGGMVDVRQAIGRLINAIVAVLGPELSPGSTFFSRCKSVVAETSSGLETSTLLECVRFTQQLVLFAPQALSVHSHVQTLLPTLSSRQPVLRHLAISTLKHLIETEPVAVINERIEEYLFSMLDEETDTEIGNLVRGTIFRLLTVSCPSCPSRWLSICHNMVLATSSRKATFMSHAYPVTGNSGATSIGDSKPYYGEDDETMIASSDAEMQGSKLPHSTIKREKHLRFRTRVFAAECLSYLPTAVGDNPAHFDLSLARKLTEGHDDLGLWLVLHLQELVSLAYQISTSQIEGMQHIGVRLLITIMEKFEKTSDPDLPGHYLLEQYQAQLVSAVRSSVNLSVGPLLLEAGLELSEKILTSSIIKGDRVALLRIFSLISRPLDDFKDFYYPSFAEWVSCKIKIRVLSAHASVKCYVYNLRKEKNSSEEHLQLVPQFTKSSSLLGGYWMSVLKDYCYISLGLKAKLGYQPFLDGVQSVLVSSKVQACLHDVWPVIVVALALDSIPMVSNGACSQAEDFSEFLLLAEMVKLDLRDFHFLWGIAFLVLFELGILPYCTNPTPLFFHRKAEVSERSFLENMHGVNVIDVPLQIFKALSTKIFFSCGYLTVDICQELIQALILVDYVPNSWKIKSLLLFSQIMQYCPDAYYENEAFICAAAELCARYLHLMSESNYLDIAQMFPSEKDCFSELLLAAEKLAYHLNHKKMWKLMSALMSAGYGIIRRASIDSHLLQVINFVKNISSSVKLWFSDDGGVEADVAARLSGSWATMISNLCLDCIKRMNLLDRNDASSKLIAKKLFFSLEESVSLIGLTFDSRSMYHDKMISSSLYKCCIGCIRMTLTDINAQVQIIGLSLLKYVAQKRTSENLADQLFCLFLLGEVLEDLFFLIQKASREQATAETIAVSEECLRLLFLFQTLPKEGSSLQFTVHMFLEAILMVFATSHEVHRIKNVALVLVSHLVHIPALAFQIKDVLLSMPITKRQKLQDIIRTAATHNQQETQTKILSPSPIIKLPLKSVPDLHEDHYHAGVPHKDHSDEYKNIDHGGSNGTDVTFHGDDEEADNDDDWDTFQSFPAEGTLDMGSSSCVPEPSPPVEPAIPKVDNNNVSSTSCIDSNRSIPELAHGASSMPEIDDHELYQADESGFIHAESSEGNNSVHAGNFDETVVIQSIVHSSSEEKVGQPIENVGQTDDSEGKAVELNVWASEGRSGFGESSCMPCDDYEIVEKHDVGYDSDVTGKGNQSRDPPTSSKYEMV